MANVRDFVRQCRSVQFINQKRPRSTRVQRSSKRIDNDRQSDRERDRGFRIENSARSAMPHDDDQEQVYLVTLDGMRMEE
jgi:hypothetical protein